MIYILLIQPSNIKMNYYFEDLRDFVSIRINHKLITFVLSLIILSLIGVPPLIGFYSKLTIFYFFTKQQNFILIFFIIIANIISGFYYLRAIRFTLFSSSKIYNLIIINYNYLFYILMITILIFLFSFLVLYKPIILILTI